MISNKRVVIDMGLFNVQCAEGGKGEAGNC